MAKKIQQNETTVASVAVEVKTIIIGGRQFTKGLYAQVRSECIIDYDDCTLRGIPWGYIHLHDKDCGGIMDHLHVVWQKGDELRKATVVMSWVFLSHYADLKDIVEDAHAALVDVYVAVAFLRIGQGNAKVAIIDKGSGAYRLSLGDGSYVTINRGKYGSFANRYAAVIDKQVNGRVVYCEGAVSDAEAVGILDRHANCFDDVEPGPAGYDTLIRNRFAEHRSAVNHRDLFPEKYDLVVSGIRSLPQLYIVT